MHIHKEEDQGGNQRKHTGYKNKCDDHYRLNVHQHNEEENDDQRGRQQQADAGEFNRSPEQLTPALKNHQLLPDLMPSTVCLIVPENF